MNGNSDPKDVELERDKSMSIKSVAKTIVTNSDLLSMFRRKYLYYDACKYFKKCYKAYLNSGYPEQIRKYRNRYNGKRCFIIGNGPSLTAADLDKLKGEFCFAANRIWLMYDKTTWRPAFYMCQDWNMIRGEKDRIREDPGPVFLGYDGLYKFGLQFDNAIAYLCDKRPCTKRENPMPFSIDCDQYVVDGTTVTYSSIQLAAYMGFSEIYLLGVDNSFQYTMDKNRKITRDESVKETYFDSRYKEVFNQFGQGKNKAFGVNDPEMCHMIYTTARNACEKLNIKIYNATRGGKLEVFERINLDAITGDNL